MNLPTNLYFWTLLYLSQAPLVTAPFQEMGCIELEYQELYI